MLHPFPKEALTLLIGLRASRESLRCLLELDEVIQKRKMGVRGRTRMRAEALVMLAVVLWMPIVGQTGPVYLATREAESMLLMLMLRWVLIMMGVLTVY